MMLNRLLRRDTRGIGAVEFALIAPVLISFVIGISQVSKLFYANADMKNALASGARAASIWPVPEEPEILAAVNERLSRSGGGAGTAVATIHDRGTDPNGNDFIVIKLDYKVDLDFIFYDPAPFTMSDTRRVFTQMGDPGDEEEDDGGATSTGTTTSGGTTTTTSGGTTSGGTTSGGTTSTSATSAGGTSTSASSTGGTTSATSASTTSTTSSTTSSSSNGNGNSNGNSGHGHGDCKKKC